MTILMVSLALINTLRYRVFHFDEWNTVKKGVLVLLNAHCSFILSVTIRRGISTNDGRASLELNRPAHFRFPVYRYIPSNTHRPTLLNPLTVITVTIFYNRFL